MPTSRCLICHSAIQAARMLRHPRAILCGEEVCYLTHHRHQTQRHAQKMRYVATYEPPADGSPESADPLFVPRERPCARCRNPFVTSARWRMFCGRCRQTRAVLFPEPDRTYELSTAARRDGGG